MTKHKKFVSLSALLLLVAFSFNAQTIFAQTENLGIVKYRSPKGWNKIVKDNVVGFSDANQATGTFCIITLYGATPGTGSPKGDFKREWNNLVVKTLHAEANPETETEVAAEWTTTAGGTTIDFQGGKALAFLTVISGGGNTVSILSIFNDKSYTTQLAAFSSSLELEKGVAEIPAPQRDAPLAAAPSSSVTTMHAAELVREFENNEIRANQVYIGKRVRIHGIINIIEIDRSGEVVLTYKSSITTRNNARCYFRKSESSRVATLNANEEGTVEGTVKGLGDGFEGAKAYLVLRDCIVP